MKSKAPITPREWLKAQRTPQEWLKMRKMAFLEKRSVPTSYKKEEEKIIRIILYER